MRIRTVTFAALVLFAAGEASGQTCLGLPAFSEGPYQASLQAAFTDGAQMFGGGGALGSDNAFARASVGFTNVDATDSTATSFTFAGGASFVVNESSRLEACPVGAVVITSGPDVGPVEVTDVGLRFGGRIGVVAAESGNMEFVPTFGLDIATDRITAELAGVETKTRDTYALVTAGVGVIFSKRIAVLPALVVPLGLDGSDAQFSITASYSFGGR